MSTVPELERLRTELRRARWTILMLLPTPVQPVLSSYRSCKTRDEVWAWEQEVIYRLKDLAVDKPASEMGDWGHRTRAYCPVCGEGSLNPLGQEGFVYPRGLLRHLTGSHKSSQ